MKWPKRMNAFLTPISSPSEHYILLSLLSLHCNPQIERRISAFMERKQMEINENNVREFCNVIDCNQGENGREAGGRVEGEPQHRLPMFGRELISTGERSG